MVNNVPMKKKKEKKENGFLSDYFFKLPHISQKRNPVLDQLPRKSLKSQNPCQIQLWSKRTITGVGAFLATAAKPIRDEEFPAAGLHIPVAAELLADCAAVAEQGLSPLSCFC